MEYTLLIYRDEAKDGEVNWEQISREYAEYAQAIAQAGVVRGGQKLQPSATATTVKITNGEQLISDGPFAEVREQLGGFFVLECENLGEALKWAARCPGSQHGTVEVRPVMAV